MHSQLHFEEQFGTEEDGLRYLLQMRWRNGFKWPRCSGQAAWDLQRRPSHGVPLVRPSVSLSAGNDLPLDPHSAAHVVPDHRADESRVLGREPLVGEVEIDERYVGGRDDPHQRAEPRRQEGAGGGRCRKGRARHGWVRMAQARQSPDLLRLVGT